MTSTYSTASSAPGQGGGVSLEQCEGICAHEESLDNALRRQLEEAVSKTRQSLEVRADAVQRSAALARHRLQPLPDLNFQAFDRSMSSFKVARNSWEKAVRDSETLHHDIERQLIDLRTARPSSFEPHVYKERLLSAERIYADVKAHRETLAAADIEARESAQRAERTSAEFRRASDNVRRLEDEISSLRLQRSEKETEATKLRHKANTPSLDMMKQQVAESIERNLSQARELQKVGQRVQQGDPDYIRDGETRDMKLAELTQKLAQLKKQHQQLLQQQSELDIDPVALNTKAAQLEGEAMDIGRRAEALELNRMESERMRTDSVAASSRDTQEARSAQERRDAVARQLSAAEAEARRQLAALQPMIQEQHSGWQNLLARQKKLDADQGSLGSRLSEAERAADSEAQMRTALAREVDELIDALHNMRGFLQRVDAAAPAPAAARDPFAEDSDPFAASAPAAAPAAPPAAAHAPAADPFAEDADPFGKDAPPLARPATAAMFADDSDAFAFPPAAAAAPPPHVEEPLPLAAAVPSQESARPISPGAAPQDFAAPAAAATGLPDEVTAPSSAPRSPAAAQAADDDDFDAFLRNSPPVLGVASAESAPDEL